MSTPGSNTQANPSTVPEGHASTQGPDFHVLLIGAGFAMFGTQEGPWNMTKRLEMKLGPRLKVDAVIEIDPPRAEAALKLKRESYVKESYATTEILSSIQEYKERVDKGDWKTPKAICVATPPLYRGGLGKQNDLELQITKLFPNVALFLEKPVATGVPWEKSVEEAKAVGARMESEHKGPISIGYCLRYLRAVQEMKKLIKENNLTVMAVNARYIMAYEFATKTNWWNKSIDQGPIVENGTHICDLARYMGGGEIDMESIHAHAVEAHEPAGHLSKKAFDESVIPDELRIPRMTAATWKYDTGAVGTLLHGTSLHGGEYAIELEVYADGWQMILADPYGTCALHVRKPGSLVAEVYPMPNDDPYYTEISHFIDNVCLDRREPRADETAQIESGPEPDILCGYLDAAKTYEMTWRIRLSSEESTKKTLERAKDKST